MSFVSDDSYRVAINMNTHDQSCSFMAAVTHLLCLRFHLEQQVMSLGTMSTSFQATGTPISSKSNPSEHLFNPILKTSFHVRPSVFQELGTSPQRNRYSAFLFSWWYAIYWCTVAVNIYSHLIGSVLFFALAFYFYDKVYPRYPNTSFADIVVFSTFFFGVAICFLLSAT